MTLEHLKYDVEGGSLAVLAAGPEDGERVLLLHGIPTNAGLFREVMPLLAEAGYRALAPNMPGYGDTRLSDEADYSLSAVADLYAAWLEAEGLNPVWLVGHDLGGAVAQFLAVRHGHLLSRLTLGNCPVGNTFPVSAVRQAIFFARIGLFQTFVSMGLIPNFFMTGQLKQGFGEPSRLTKDMKQTIFWDSKVRDEQGLAEFIKHLRHLRNTESVEIMPQLKEITVPTLVLWSTRDAFQPSDIVGTKLHRMLPDDSVYRAVSGAGHFMPLEDPQGYVEALLDWREGRDG